MKNYNNIDTVCTKRLTTAQLKFGQDYIAGLLEDENPKAEISGDVHEILKSLYR